jgi:hypothetical protein
MAFCSPGLLCESPVARVGALYSHDNTHPSFYTRLDGWVHSHCSHPCLSSDCRGNYKGYGGPGQRQDPCRCQGEFASYLCDRIFVVVSLFSLIYEGHVSNLQVFDEAHSFQRGWRRERCKRCAPELSFLFARTAFCDEYVR